jgi:hypothetical protein
VTANSVCVRLSNQLANIAACERRSSSLRSR